MCIISGSCLINWLNKYKTSDDLQEIIAVHGNEFNSWSQDDFTYKNLQCFFKQSNKKFLHSIEHVISYYTNTPIENHIPYVPKEVEERLVVYLDKQLENNKICAHYGHVLVKCLEGIGETTLADRHRLMFKHIKVRNFQ